METVKTTAEKLMVCISPNPSSAKLVNSTKKMADALHAQWFAVYVEDPKMLLLPEKELNHALDAMRLAEQLGAETITLSGQNIAEEIANFAGQRNITRIIVGKPRRTRWKGFFFGSPVARLVRTSGEIDVYVISGEPVEQREAKYLIQPEGLQWSDYGTGFIFFILANTLCFSMYGHFDLSNLIMVYLLGVLVTSIGCGRGPAILVSLLSVLAFDFFFVPPRFTFTVDDSQYIVTFIVMFLVALVISHLTTLMRQQTEAARLQERQAAAMHGLSRQLVSTRGVEMILEVAVQYISEIFNSWVVALLPDKKGKLKVTAGDAATVLAKDIIKEFNTAQSAYSSGQMTGWGTEGSPATEILYVPLVSAHSTLGVLGLRPRDPGRFLVPDQLHLLESLAKQVALALEVERLTGSGAAKET